MRKIYFSFIAALFLLLAASNRVSAQCAQNFDGVAAPALPTGWTTDVTGAGIGWITSTVTPSNAPNDGFGPETASVGVTNFTSELFTITSPAATMTFRNMFNLENTFDGMVLEISIGGGPYQDILAAGGTFITGGYTGTLSVNFMNPLPGRQAWTSLSGGTTAAPTYITTTVSLPAAANGQSVRFKWRVGSDATLAATGANGARIDDITMTGCGAVAACAENFDGVAAPALPLNWTTDVTGIGIAWVTSTVTPDNAPNDAFGPETTNVGVTNLTSAAYAIVSPAATMTFRNMFNLENTFDGMVLEISIGGGPYQDILAAGGTFITGGYTGTLSVNFMNPLPGRQAWTGLSGGTTAAPSYLTTTITLPAIANGQNVQFKWRVGSDASLAAAGANGARIDNITTTGTSCGGACAGTPSSGAITGPATACGGNPVALGLTGNSSGPGISIQWQSATVSGGPYTNIPGATGANYNFTAAGGTTYYVAIVTCSNGGASATTAQHTLVVGAPVHSAVSATVTTACSPGAATVTGTVSGGVLPSLTVLGTSGTINLGIPDNTPAGINTTIVLPASTITNAADLRVRITANHSWVGDLKFTLTSPCGTTFLFDRPGVPATTVGNLANLGTSNATTPPPAVYTFDLSAATVIPETAPPAGFIPAGNYLPSNTAGASHNWTGLTFPCSAAGNWQLNISDNAVGDLGTLASWQILAPAVYTHTLTGPGTITQNPATGPNNSIANFTVTNLPAGLNAFTLTSTDGIGCSVATNVAAAVTQTPVVTIVPPAPVICAGAIQQLTATAAAISTQTFASGAINLAFPDNTPAGVTTPAIVVPAGINFAAASNLRILINARHSWVGDLVFRVNSPCGTTFLFDRPGVPATTVGNLANLGTSNATTPPPAVYIFDLSAATVIPETAPPAGFIPAGNYLPSNTAGTSHNWTGLTFPCAGTGNWTLTISDNAVGDLGALVDWAILYDPPAPPVTWTPVTNVYTDPLATIPYVAGTPMSTIWVKPPITTVYTASATNGACTGTANVTVTVNQLPAITAQPVALAAPVCPGFNVTYTVGATGTGLSYQWQVSTDNGVTYSNIINNPPYTGATTASLLITNVTTAMNGYRYRVIVSGTCPPAVTSNPVTLVVSTPPTITTQPVNRIVCVNQTTTFSVVAAGVPAPTIYQWQVSTDNGVTFTNLTTNGSYTATYTIPPALITMNNYRYRVIITNTCGQTITSSVVTLTVNALPVVTAAALASRICISDTLIPLSGSPVGGSWSGIGVSGFNFVPSSTAVGTYTLTYTYTNAAGCTATASVVAKVEDCQERLRLLSDDGVILYPNPNNGRFNIRINSTLYNYLGMKVYNAQGQLLNGQAMNSILVSPVYTGLVYGRVIPIDLSKLPAGIYMVKFYYDDGVRTSEKAFKVIIGAH